MRAWAGSQWQGFICGVMHAENRRDSKTPDTQDRERIWVTKVHYVCVAVMAGPECQLEPALVA